MENWNQVKSINKIIDIFGETVSFHDAEIIGVKYDGQNASIKIDSEGFIKTASIFDEKYKKFKNVYIKINFENVSLFEIDYDYGTNFIDEIVINKSNEGFIVTINNYYLKIVCKEIKIDNVDVVYKQDEKQNKSLDKLLKSNL